MECILPIARWQRALTFVLVLTFCVPAPARAAEEEAPAASLHVSGYGFFGNRKLRQILSAILLDDEKPAAFDSTSIEDAVFLLFSQVTQDGFLQPTISANLTLRNGNQESYQFSELASIEIPAGFQVTRAEFQIDKGQRYHFTDLAFTGLESINRDRAESFFMETGVLLPLDLYRVYTPRKLERGMSNLVEALQRQGYQEAQVTLENLERDDQNGHVRVVIRVQEGSKFLVRSVRQEVTTDTNQPPLVRITRPIAAYSRLWEQNFAQNLRTNLYDLGYPDTTVTMSVVNQEPTNGVVRVDTLAKIESGPRVKVGEVRFTGNERTKESVMRRRVRLKQGEWLDRMEAEQGRFRLSHLGVFDSVDLSYQPAAEEPALKESPGREAETRDVIYRVDEGKRIDLSLLFGLGSYELLRGGFELSQHNLFGRAHQARLRAVQSFKSSRASYTYTMPELFGEDWDVFFRASGFRREEVSFTRTEYGGGAGMERYFRAIDSRVSLQYQYQILDTSSVVPDLEADGVKDPTVGAFIFDLEHDHRDNPLYPRRGHRVFGNLELGSEWLGGDVNYQRVELAGSYHRPFAHGRRVHLGLSHGIAASVGDASEDLPLARRFFPGGENSIRGYPEGEASPRNESGEFVGGETYLLGTVELEQALTPSLSFVLFSDSLGVARRLSDYPFDETLFSAGGGLRWRTIVGPVRLEYGHNLNPRPHDPSGTVHFSLGFPF